MKTETATNYATNYASSVSSILLQNVEIILGNSLIKKKVMLKIIFNKVSQRGCITKRTKNFLDLKPNSKERILGCTFGNKEVLTKLSRKVSLNLENKANESYSI